MSSSWTDAPMLAFDTETTGVLVEEDHILTASLVHIQGPPTRKAMADTLMINPGVEVPAESSKIHGLTTEYIKANGGEPAESLEAICLVIAAVMQDRQTALVGMNLVFDLTMLDRNCRRWGVTPLTDRVGQIRPALDAMILDKKVDPFRKGTGMRKLDNIAPLYRVPRGDAHTSEADALCAARVVWRIGRLYPPIGELDLGTIHELQAAWKKTQDTNLARWLKGKGRDTTGVDGQWPIRLPSLCQHGVGCQCELQEVALW